jgi:hypothetical protein
MANRFAIAVFVAAAVVYGTTSSFAQSSTTPSADQSSTTSSSTRTFNVCVGGFWFPLKENKCQPHDIYVFRPLAFLDPLLARPALVVEGHDALSRAAHVRHDEADAGIKFLRDAIQPWR